MDAFPQVLLGPGDDCAVVEVNDGGPILLKVDQLIEHRHFTLGTPLELIARKALARPLSDIAAMAGTPIAALAGCVMRRDYPQSRANALFDAIHASGMALGVPVVGGDIASFLDDEGPLTLSISMIGRVHARRGPVRRSTACAGDDVYVTGTIGGSFLESPNREFVFVGGGKHLTFTPRVREATWLADALDGDLHAMMDVSDGLGLDAARLATASGVRVELESSLIPLSEPTRRVLHAIADGEDYELLFTVSRGTALPTHVPGVGTPLTRIGTVVAGAGCVLREGDRVIDVSQKGFEHA